MTRIIAITGVSRGLGRALVRRWATAGHRVAGCSRSGAAIEALRREHGDAHRFDAVDIADDDSVADWARDVCATLGVPDLVVNNAGLINANAALWRVPPEEFRSVVDVNLVGTFHVIRHFVPAMIAAGRGVVANFSSGWGRSTAPEVGPYCATKWAVEGLTHSLAQELPPGLAAVSVNPGVIRTAMLESCFGEAAAMYPDPDAWAKRADPFLLGIGPEHNGQALTVPG